MDKIVPGMEELQIPFAKTIENIWPILKKDPDIIQNMMPTLHDIFNSVANEKTISKKDFASWGKRLLKSGGPHLKKWGISTKESQSQDLIKTKSQFTKDVFPLAKVLNFKARTICQQCRICWEVVNFCISLHLDCTFPPPMTTYIIRDCHVFNLPSFFFCQAQSHLPL